MNAERWQKIKSLFDAAQELEPTKRERFLAAACNDDAELRGEVEKLLASFDDAESFMEKPAAAEVASMFEEKKTLMANHATGNALDGKLVAGTVLASRYRIIGLLGRGGMGEVYRAEDIKLSQTVALKFLPDKLEKDRAALRRFHSEVRLARQVAHPNVCRVFDIGEIDGRHFLSMEFVDGDDLSSLLRRVGRLTSERAVEISRQLCTGLHAVHDAGILHRDFKPANIIIDSKGKARITDFGIAGQAAEVAGDNARIGTPAYMSPEQITGKEISTRSDIYALGLVLYEIFTGKQAFQADSIPELIRKHQIETPTNPSDYVKDIDPLVEKVIFQCLEKNPADRPPSALHVALALPGGNPLQVALEAGETPSPEMVAAAPKKGALKPLVAVALLAGVLVIFGLLMPTAKSFALYRQVPLEKSPEVLAERSREIAGKFGYAAHDWYHGFVREDDYIKYLRQNDQSRTRWQAIADGQPAVFHFWYRQSPEPLVTLGGSFVKVNDPPTDKPGMAQVRLDTRGRLVFFEAVPPQTDDAASRTEHFDWATIFKEAGFDFERFQETESRWTPTQAFDERRAWTGVYPEQSDVSIRIEAAAYRGKPVNFQIVEPWDAPAAALPYQGGVSFDVSGAILLAMFFTILAVGAWFAVRNVRVGRGDWRGAFRVALFLFASLMTVWIFETHHVASLSETMLLITGLQSALFWSCFAGMMYLAFEPYLRRHAPERVIAWNRLLAGEWRDPLVGRDVLVGVFAGMLLMILACLSYFIAVWIGEPPPAPFVMSNPGGKMLSGLRGFPVLFLNQISASLVMGFMISFLVLFFTMLFRHKLLGSAAAWLLLVAFSISGKIADGLSVSAITAIIFPTILIFTAARFGVLAAIAMIATHHLIVFYPITTELTAWYAADFVLCASFLIALAFYGFYTSLAGQPVFQTKFLDEKESL